MILVIIGWLTVMVAVVCVGLWYCKDTEDEHVEYVRGSIVDSLRALVEKIR